MAAAGPAYQPKIILEVEGDDEEWDRVFGMVEGLDPSASKIGIDDRGRLVRVIATDATMAGAIGRTAGATLRKRNLSPD